MTSYDDVMSYQEYLVFLGFTEEQAERIADGRDVDALPEQEFLTVVNAIEHDLVEPLRPLVEKYGWSELLYRFSNSATTDT